MDLTETAVLRISAKQVDRLYSTAQLDFAVTLIAGVLLLGGAWLKQTQVSVLALFALPIVLGIVRLLIAHTYNLKPRASAAVKRWELVFSVGAVVAGLAWGAIAAYLIYAEVNTVAIATMGITAALSLAGTVLYAGSFPISLAHAAAALAPPAVAAVSTANQTGALLAAGMLGAFAATYMLARTVKRLVWESVLAVAEAEQLTNHLDQRRTQVEKLNVALKTNADKREQAEITLRRTAADLGLVQGKAKALAATLERVSPICQVTGLSNRRHFNGELDVEWRRATREQKPMSLLIVEVDDFEEFVAASGQQSADTLFKKVGQTVKGFGRRPSDLAARYEDAKLALMLPGCDARNATRMAEALRKRIDSAKIAHPGETDRETLTIHVGVATIKPSRGIGLEEILKRAEAALYEARFQGGNKVVPYKPLSKLKLERWDQPNDGALNEQTLTQKLLVWGYDNTKDILRPGEAPKDHLVEEETVLAILTGELLIDVEGHTMSIKAGDTIFVPSGVALLLQVSGEHPVIRFTATRSK